MKATLIVSTLLLSLAVPVMAQSTHPSDSYPGKGGSQDSTNAASAHAPENMNPSSGGQSTGAKSGNGM